MTDDERARLGAALLDHLPDALIHCDRDGVIRFWNQGAARIFGFVPEEAVGRSLDIIIPERLRERHWSGFHRMLATGRSNHRPEDVLSVPAVTRSGATLSIQFTVAPVRDGDGRVDGIVAVLRDATATYAELRRLRARSG